ncbi:bifunctional riboflavin kinase/FAD synthetase [Bacillus alkalicellulosilyticus]|uniref:bifunctional riboflavin kinase/FAD synthetase n=1 Tax=Alkalihalobacterium alkalicellulosilyticum TaxID=1912214 RepID=UPI000998D01F|nr:bifunctional riboflavin kinase/FAD synthetase [Bacillus alkalicellulosilyticus]
METIYLSHPHQLTKENHQPTVMALGFFDGVHLGHQEVIKTAVHEAKNRGCISAVMTFSPHPKEVLAAHKLIGPMKYITPIEQKQKYIERLDVDRLYIVTFDIAFSKLTPQQFVDDYLLSLHVCHVVAGFDYTYGHLGKGTMETLPFHSRGQFTQTTIGKLKHDDVKISSTQIRKLLADGKVEEVDDYLGRFYQVEGTVIHGEKRGRTIGFPTANIEVQEKFLLPRLGVYAVSLQTEDKSYNGLCNLGYKPTFTKDNLIPSLEVHLFDFDGDLYDKQVTVTFYLYIRSEQKFLGIEQLVDQITKDKEVALRYFS